MKKIISLLLVAMLALSSAIAVNAEEIRDIFGAKAESVSARGAVMDSGTWGSLTWEVSDDYVLTISGSGSMNDFSSSSSTDAWRKYRTSINTVKIGSGVTSVGKYAFYNFTNLRSVELPDTLQSIGQQAFQNCTNAGFTSINIPNGVTTIGSSAFNTCKGLTSVTLPNTLTTLNDSAFSSCTSLTSISLPSSLTTVGRQCFYGCTSLKSVDIADGVTTIGQYMFYGCTSLESIEMPDSVTTLGYNAFDNCTSLSSVKLSNGLTQLNSSFAGCKSLTSLEIPESVTTLGSNALSSCSNLTTVYVKNANTTFGSSALPKMVTVVGYNPSTAYNYCNVSSYQAKFVEYGSAYEIALNPNGGSLSTGTGEIKITKTEGVDVSLPIPTREGYLFAGWSRRSTIAGICAYDTLDIETTYLEAMWIALNTITSNESQVVEFPADTNWNIVKDANGNVTLPMPATEGRIFGGWSTNPNGVGPGSAIASDKANLDELVKAGSANLYPTWLHLFPNEGTIPADAVLNHSRAFEDPFQLPIPTRDGYIFAGWGTSDGGEIAGYDSVTVQQIGNKSAVYAGWIKLEPNGGELPENFESTLNSDGSISLPTPTKEGAVFFGWSKANPSSNSITTVYYDSIMPTELSTGDNTLYAVWSNLQLNGGQLADDALDQIKINSDGTMSLPIPTKENHAFLGWAKPNMGREVIGYDSISIADGIKGYYNALWIELDPAGGTIPESVDMTATRNEDGSFTIPLPIPTKDDCVFVSWLNSAKNQRVGYDTYTFTGDSSETKLIAEWINLDPHITNNVFAAGEFETESRSVDDPIPLPIATTTQEEMVFAGWSKEFNASPNEVLTYNLLDAEELPQPYTSTTVGWSMGAMELYSTWIDIDTNGGFLTLSSDEFAQLNKDNLSGDTIIMPIPAKDNAVFIGWTGDKESVLGSKVSYDLLKIEDALKTMYAHYLDLDPKGGFIPETKPVEITHKEDGTVDLSLPIPQRVGYAFAGWTESIVAGEQTGDSHYADVIAFDSINSEDIHCDLFEAVWIELDTNGGGWESLTDYSTVKDVQIPVNPNHIFVGWSDSLLPTCANVVAYDNLEEMNKEMTVVHAVWLGLEPNGGTLPEGTFDRVDRDVDDPIVLPTPVKEGKEFDGWYTSLVGGEKIVDPKVLEDDNPILYAHWVGEDSGEYYTLTADANGGRIDSVIEGWTGASETSKKTLLAGEAYGTLPTASLLGNRFEGWYTEKTGGTKVTSATIMGNADTTIYAHWKPAPDDYTVVYMQHQTNQGIIFYQVDENVSGSVTLTAAPITNPKNDVASSYVKDGVPYVSDQHLFAGWFKTVEASQYNYSGDNVDPSQAFGTTIDLSTCDVLDSTDIDGETYENVVFLYAGFVKAGKVSKDGNDKNNYGASSLKGFSLEGVQIRSKEVADKYQDGDRNTEEDALRFVTVYSNSMIEELKSLKGKNVSYGYTAYAKSDVSSLTKLDKKTSGAVDVDCTKEGDQNHRMFGDYRLSTLVIKYDGADSAYKGDLVEARAYVDYTDANGFTRRGYNTYSDSKFAGGCRTSFNATMTAVSNAYDALARVA